MYRISKLFVLLLLCLSSTLLGQTMVQENKLWSISTKSHDAWSYWGDTHWIKFEGDSVLNDTVYKVIYRSDDENQNHWYRNGAIREDSLKRIYIHSEGQQRLLYDFGLEIGDSIHQHGDHYVYISGIDSLKLGPDSALYKRLFFADRKDSDYQDSPWIEGIGSVHGVLSGAYHMFMTGSTPSLVCFSRNDTLIYNISPEQYQNTCFPLGYPEGISESRFKKGIVDVEYGDHYVSFSCKNPRLNDAELLIYDSLGRMQMKASLRADETYELPKERLTNGIYFFLFKSGQEFESGKLLIH